MIAVQWDLALASSLPAESDAAALYSPVSSAEAPSASAAFMLTPFDSQHHVDHANQPPKPSPRNIFVTLSDCNSCSIITLSASLEFI